MLVSGHESANFKAANIKQKKKKINNLKFMFCFL